MDWREILEIHKGLDLFFNVSIPTEEFIDNVNNIFERRRFMRV